MNVLAKSLIVIGLVLAGSGLLLLALGKIPGIGKLPGDIYIRKGDFSFYFPVATCIVISLILTVLFNLFLKR